MIASTGLAGTVVSEGGLAGQDRQERVELAAVTADGENRRRRSKKKKGQAIGDDRLPLFVA
jgi:hypothetical protein